MSLQRIRHNLYWKMKLLKQAIYIRHVIAELSKFIQSACKHFQIPFYRGFFENSKGPGTSSHAKFSCNFFKNLSFAIWRKLAKFRYWTQSKIVWHFKIHQNSYLQYMKKLSPKKMLQQLRLPRNKGIPRNLLYFCAINS